MKMKKIELMGMRDDRKNILDFLQKKGVVEISSIKKEDGDDVFYGADSTDKLRAIESQLAIADRAVAILKDYMDKKDYNRSALEGKRQITNKEYTDFKQKYSEVYEQAEHIIRLQNELTELKAEAVRSNTAKEELVPWEKLEVPLNYTGTKHTTAFVGAIGGQYTHEELVLKLAEVAPELENLYVEILFDRKEQTYILATAMKEDRELLKNALDDLDFQYPFSREGKTPHEKLGELEKSIAKAEEQIEIKTEKLTEKSLNYDDFILLSDCIKIRIEKYKNINKLVESKHTFRLEGYITEKDSESLTKAVDNSFDCYVQLTDLPDDEEAPIKLKNSWFSEPVEDIVSSYEYPTRHGVDPTAIVSFFYYAMFGLMFSDAGYGLILVLACGFCMLKFKNMEDSLNKTVRLFFWCGVSTMFWGIVFSSYFGDIINVTSKTFFGHEIGIPPLWFSPTENPMLLLVFCLGIGVVHLITGCIMNGLVAVKSKNFNSLLCGTAFPILFIVSIGLIFVSTDMFYGFSKFKVAIPDLLMSACKIGIIVACAGTVLFAGESKNFILRILQGLYALYNMLTGWLSDVLSYARLLALGLATGIIGSVVNTLGALPANIPVLGVIIFIFVFIMGHSINFGLNILGAYVHSNRLEYIEFFSKFYEGGGKKFVPFALHTEYYKIREDIKNG